MLPNANKLSMIRTLYEQLSAQVKTLEKSADFHHKLEWDETAGSYRGFFTDISLLLGNFNILLNYEKSPAGLCAHTT